MRISDWSSDVCSSDLALDQQSLMHRLTHGGAKIDGCNRARRACRGAVRLEAHNEGGQTEAVCNARGDEPQQALVQIGRASCRARVCQYVSISVVSVYLKKHPQQIMLQ